MLQAIIYRFATAAQNLAPLAPSVNKAFTLKSGKYLIP